MAVITKSSDRSFSSNFSLLWTSSYPWLHYILWQFSWRLLSFSIWCHKGRGSQLIQNCCWKQLFTQGFWLLGRLPHERCLVEIFISEENLESMYFETYVLRILCSLYSSKNPCLTLKNWDLFCWMLYIIEKSQLLNGAYCQQIWILQKIM